MNHSLNDLFGLIFQLIEELRDTGRNDPRLEVEIEAILKLNLI